MLLCLEIHKWWSKVCAVRFHAGVGEGLCFCKFYFILIFFLRYLFLSHRKWESWVSSQCCSLLGPQTPRKEQRDAGNFGETFSEVRAMWPAFLPCQNSCLYLSLTTKGFSEVWLELKPILMLSSSTPRTKRAKADKRLDSRCAYFGGKSRNLRR